MVKLSDVAKVMRRAEESGEYTAADWIEKIILRGLTRRQRDVREIIKKNPWISTPDMAKLLNIKLNHTGRHAKTLYELGLVDRRTKFLGSLRASKYYIWHIK